MEHNTDRILWTVLVLAIGVALFVSFKPAANGLLGQTTEKIQTVVGGVNDHTSDSSSTNSSSSSSSSTNNTDVGTNLLPETHADWQSTTPIAWSVGDAITVDVEPNTEYTAQSEIKSDVNTDTWHVEVWTEPTGSNRTILGPGQETRVNGGISQVTFNSGDYTRVYIIPHVSGTGAYESKVIYWRHEKLEKGSKATPYTP